MVRASVHDFTPRRVQVGLCFSSRLSLPPDIPDTPEVPEDGGRFMCVGDD